MSDNRQENTRVEPLIEPLVEALTRREREILALLAQGYSGPEIAEQLTLAISSVKWHIQHLYGKLGVNSKRQALIRAKELGLLGTSPLMVSGESQTATPTLAPPVIHPQQQPLPTTLPRPKHNLPQPVTRFFGRAAEIAQIKERLTEHRLVTLTGSEGVGKTRLALRVAEDVVGDYADGVGWIELALLTDPALVARQVAASLGRHAEAGQPLLDELIEFLRPRQLLLVLDNGEHLLGACAQLAETLLSACPRLKILTSSREALGPADETIFPVAPLPYPDPDRLPSIESLGDYAALSLFLDRARAVMPDYQVTTENAGALARICQRLDGLPLALELAAAGLRSLSAEALATRLGEAFSALTRGNRTTLWVAISLSYQWLSEEERLLLQRLTVFGGDFSLEAAEAVDAGGSPETGQLQDQLEWLAVKGMLMAEGRPGSETRYRVRELVRQYAREKLRAAAEDEAPAPGESPFMGLHYFDEADADLYFGREALVEKLAQYLRQHRFLAVVVGASGSGKSSLVRAGLLPRLRQGGEYAALHVLTPTARPLEALALSLTHDSESVTATTTLMDDLRKDGRSLHVYARKQGDGRAEHGRLLIIIDQFEELFTLCHDEAERRAYIENVITAISPENDGPTTVVITLRADFYAFCAPYPALREAVARHQEYIGPMRADELRRAIEEPAWLGGWTLEAGLVDTLLKDVGAEPGALPLLSHALLETWHRRRGRALTLRGYAESGGVRGAIAKTAESVYTALTPEEQAIARNIFLRLTELGEGTQDTRRRAAQEELMPRAEEAEAVRGVLKILADARLVTVSEDTVEVAHEALIREWPTLREWLNGNRDGLRLHRQVSRDAEEWQSLKRDEGMLYRGARLAQTVEWAEWSKATTELNALEREFIASSQMLAEREETEREAQRQRELRLAEAKAEAERQRAEAKVEAERQRANEQERATVRLRARNRVITGVGALAFLAALIAAFFSLQSNTNARQAQAANTQSAQNLSAAHVANTQSAQNLSVANDNAATAQAASTQAVANQVEAQRLAQLARAKELVANSKTTFDQDPVNSLLLVVEAWKVALQTGQPVSAVEQALHDALANPGGLPMIGHDGPVMALAFSPDGRWLATGGGDHTTRLWDIGNPAVAPVILSGHQGAITALAFSPDGHWLATGSQDATIRLWDMGDPVVEPLVLSGHESAITALAFRLDGKWLATGSRDATARLWDMGALSAGPVAEPMVLRGHTEDLTVLAFSPDGKWLATGSEDNTARLWDMGALSADPTAESVVLQGHKDTITALAFSPDGRWLATGNIDRTVQLWDMGALSADPAAEPVVLRGHEAPISALAFSPDGKWLATGSEDNGARLWDMGVLSADSTAAPIVLPGHAGIPILDFTFHFSYIKALAFSADGKWLAMGGADNTTHLWDMGALSADPTAEPIILRGHEEDINVLAFSPDGRWLATGSEDNTTRLWDMSNSTTEPIVLRGHEAAVIALAFAPGPQGKWLATGSNDDTARIWELIDPSTEPIVLPGGTDIVPVGFGAAHRPSYFNVLAFSPDGMWLATGGGDDTARLWDMGALSADPTAEPIVLRGHEAPINTIAFSPDGRWLATGSGDTSGLDATARLWNMSDLNAESIVLRGHEAAINTIAFSPDGRWLATGSRDFTARLWDMGALSADPTAEPVVLRGHKAPISSLAFSPDGKWLATGSNDYTARLWDMDAVSADPTAEPIVLRGHENFINILAFSPDGKWLATGSDDNTARLWDMSDPTAAPVVLRGHEGWITVLAFSPDGMWLATGSIDATTRLWDMGAVSADPTAGPIVLRGHESWVNALAFSPDGTWLATGSGDPGTATSISDNTTRLWSVNLDALAQRACQFAGRNFTQAKWRQYFPGELYHKTCEQWPEGK